ncbi:hypothetical protein [Desulfuromonas thiophila]|uniref:Uncharacterized protein n=1 Tax=Desulfuromonas thiophila TaxID=57664 RepID=A0A1G7ALK0_9BACT|nr:hypothetical protein [Desulfuromonas thiophila]SDE15672.1 hypothetical protein SAMN05661003_104109 [Desulfuromonas thiophila]
MGKALSEYGLRRQREALAKGDPREAASFAKFRVGNEGLEPVALAQLVLNSPKSSPWDAFHAVCALPSNETQQSHPLARMAMERDTDGWCSFEFARLLQINNKLTNELLRGFEQVVKQKGSCRHLYFFAARIKGADILGLYELARKRRFEGLFIEDQVDFATINQAEEQRLQRLAKERAEREAKERAEREAREAKERAEREVREAKERAEREVREAKERKIREKQEKRADKMAKKAAEQFLKQMAKEKAREEKQAVKQQAKEEGRGGFSALTSRLHGLLGASKSKGDDQQKKP